MDFFPDFNELGIWGYIVPLIVLLAVVVPIWRLSARTSIPSRILRTAAYSAFWLIVISIVFIAIVGIVFRISNPTLL